MSAAGRTRALATRAVLVLAAAVLALASPAVAEVLPGNIAAGSIATAYPITAGTTYNGAFQPDSGSYHDIDYLSLSVANAGETLEFTIRNTTSACQDPNNHFCPVYATLMDRTDNQLGGPNSGAGTIATWADTETFDWTFAAPGTYYLLMESDGNEPAGNPSYAVSFSVVSTGAPARGTGTAGSSAPGGAGSAGGQGASGASQAGGVLVKSLRVLPRQRGRVVRAGVTLGRQALFAIAVLYLPRAGKKPLPLTIVTRSRLAAGAHRLMLRIPPKYGLWRELKRHRTLLVLEKLGFLAAGRRQTFSRYVVLTQ